MTQTRFGAGAARLVRAIARRLGRLPVGADCDTMYHELQEALARPSCAVCRMVRDSTERHLRYLFHESVNDPDVREELRASIGYCDRHTADAARCGTALGVSIAYNDMAVQAMRRIEAIARGKAPRPRAECPVCIAQREEGALYAGALAEGLAEPALRDAYGASDGLCLAHLEIALREAGAGERAFLAEQERARLRGLSAELQEFIRKNDYRFASETVGAEGDAWLRAMAKIAGPSTLEP